MSPSSDDRHDEELAMFPLGSVLMPGMLLPLQIFEPRYRYMMDMVLLSDRREFGVVLIERGSEVGGGDVRTDVGTVAEVVDVARHDDGRVAIAAVGVRRLRVREWLPDDPHPRAVVEDWPDVPPVADDPPVSDVTSALDDARTTLTRVVAIAAALGLTEHVDLPQLSDDPTQRAYQLATMSPLGAMDRQRLLATPDLPARVRLLGELLADQEVLLRAELDRREE